MGLFGGIASLLGGGLKGLTSFLGASSSKKAVKKATQAQIDALNKAIEEQHRQFDVTQANFEPFRQAGLAGLPEMLNLMGLNGDMATAGAMARLKESPIYQSLYNNGEEAILQNAAATGGVRGGNTQRSLAGFGADTLASVLSDQLSRLGGLAGLGEGATNAVAGFGAHTADAVSNFFNQQGQARASGALARGGINSQMWNNAGSFLDQIVSAFMPGGVGAGGGMSFAGF